MASQASSEPKQDKMLEDTFPASDPPANTGITGGEEPAKPPSQGGVEGVPTGTPTSDRHAVETAHQPEDKA